MAINLKPITQHKYVSCLKETYFFHCVMLPKMTFRSVFWNIHLQFYILTIYGLSLVISGLFGLFGLVGTECCYSCFLQEFSATGSISVIRFVYDDTSTDISEICGYDIMYYVFTFCNMVSMNLLKTYILKINIKICTSNNYPTKIPKTSYIM